MVAAAAPRRCRVSSSLATAFVLDALEQAIDDEPKVRQLEPHRGVVQGARATAKGGLSGLTFAARPRS